MSGWDGYIDNIMASSCVADVAIYGKEGSLWVAFNEGELKNIPAKTIADLQNNKDAIYESGVVLGNKRYTLVNDQSNALNWVCFKSKACKEDEQKYSAIITNFRCGQYC
ncbi:profilin-1-like isoform X2 [Scyliorhinus torazame]|uniref:profilin-1-like isoform X2 n=1 Tax=Scyliorhinus torazame TaxID=75743 RepID=UPI003B5A280C